ncbi:MAG: RHS repeat-associated core domain-containing protein, partial [Terriglobales bacterium]
SYAPYGALYADSAPGAASQWFTGVDSDTSTLLSDFPFREYSSIQGRWLSPDPAGLAAVNPANPQTWNAYAYVANHPLEYTDPLGLNCDPRTGKAIPNTGPCLHTSQTITVVGSPWEFADPVFWQFAVGAEEELGQISGGGGSGAGTGTGASGNSGARNGIVSNTTKITSTLQCAANAADQVSLAGLLGHIPGLKSGIGGFLVRAIGGNTFSGATDLVSSFVNGQAGGHSVFYNMAMAEAAGPTQGFRPVLEAAGADVADSPFGTGPVDAVTEAALGDAAPVVGQIKLAYDFATFFGAAVGCAIGVVR